MPPQTLSNVIAYLSNSFAELRRVFPAQHTFGEAEPTLTLSLSQHADLQDRKEAAGISGSFVAEGYAPIREASGVIRKNGRTDILFTLGDRGAPQVIFEFKKLDGKNTHRALYFSEGVARFASGKYAPTRRQGVMVGLSRVAATRESIALVAALANPRLALAHNCLPDVKGNVVHAPSVLAPGVADFDTVHDRSQNAVPDPITVAHVVLDCP